MTTTAALQIVLPDRVEPFELQVVPINPPAPAAGQALIETVATGISFAEQQMRRGKYYDQPTFPFVPGYDVVGTVTAVGPDVDASWLGGTVAALTKTGGWASHVLVDVERLVKVPTGLDPAAVETLVVNGVTAWQLLHREAGVRPGQTVVVLGANGGVGSTLVQLAAHAGVTVIGAAAPRHHDAVRALGAIPVDRHTPDLAAQIRALAPGGVAAVFDHVGGPGVQASFELLAGGGTLVCYGSASTKDDPGSSRLPILALFGRLMLWNALPNRRRARFYNLWSGATRLGRSRPEFWVRIREDLGQVLTLLADGTLQPQIAARIPLAEAARGLELAESGTVLGKVVLVSGTQPVDGAHGS